MFGLFKKSYRNFSDRELALERAGLSEKALWETANGRNPSKYWAKQEPVDAELRRRGIDAQTLKYPDGRNVIG